MKCKSIFVWSGRRYLCEVEARIGVKWKPILMWNVGLYFPIILSPDFSNELKEYIIGSQFNDAAPATGIIHRRVHWRRLRRDLGRYWDGGRCLCKDTLSAFSSHLPDDTNIFLTSPSYGLLLSSRVCLRDDSNRYKPCSELNGPRSLCWNECFGTPNRHSAPDYSLIDGTDIF
jgi:hypothetical protein